MNTTRHLAIALLSLAAFTAPASAAIGLTRVMAGDLPVTLVYDSYAPARPWTQGPFTLEVALDAPPPADRRPLIVMSHGTAGSPLSDHEMAATLARAGFVVAQPMHGGDNALDSSRAGPAAWVTRPQEISRTIDALAAHPVWGAHVDTTRVGVHGMSAGGGTALAMAGGRWRTLNLVRHCLAHGDEDPGFCFNGLPTAAEQAGRRASFERARNVPEAFLPAAVTAWHGGREDADPRPDPRVAAVSVAVPLVAIFSDDSLARIAIPVAVLRAGQDRNLLPRFHVDRLLQACKTCVPLGRLEGAGHMDLLGPWPEPVARAVAARQAAGGEPEPGFDPRERAAAFQAVADFFVRHLKP